MLAGAKVRKPATIHCRFDHCVQCRLHPHSIQRSQRSAVQLVSQSRVSRLVVRGWGADSVGCLAGARFACATSSNLVVNVKLSSLSRWRCFGCYLCATAAWSKYRIEGQEQAAGTLGNATTVETLALSVSCQPRCFSTKSQNPIQMRGRYLSTPTTVV